MVAFIDLDSILYTSVYKIVSISQMREAIDNYGKDVAKQWLKEEVLNEGINRCENELLKIQEYLQSIMLQEITSYELFITTCHKSFRVALTSNYKSNRKKNNYVWMLREHYKFNGAAYDDYLEADDLIAIRAKEEGLGNCVVVSMDKDLKQIGGYYWSYYKQDSKDFLGNILLNDHGNKVKEYKQKEVIYIDEKEASFLFWCQMLSGDSTDCISGITPITAVRKKEILKETKVNLACRVGEATAIKILKDSKNHFITVARQYILRSQKENFWLNYKLLKIGEKPN